MAKDFNKNSSKELENGVSTKWDISPEQQQEIKEYQNELVNRAETEEMSSDEERDLRREAVKSVYDRRKEQAEAYIEALDENESIHDKINSGETTRDRLRKKRQLESNMDDLVRRDERYKISTEYEVKDEIKKELIDELRKREGQRKEGLQKYPESDAFFGTQEWEDRALNDRENRKNAEEDLKKEFYRKSKKLTTKITNIIPFVRKRRQSKFDTALAELGTPTEAELKVWDFDEGGNLKTNKLGYAEHSEWYKNQQRREQGRPSKEEIQEVYDSRRSEIDKTNRLNKLKNIFENENNRGVAEILAEKGVPSEIMNNPVFMKHLEVVLREKRPWNGKPTTISERLEGVKVYGKETVKFSSIDETENYDSHKNGTSKRSYFTFDARGGNVAVTELSAKNESRLLDNYRENPKARFLESEYSETRTIYDANGDIKEVSIDRVKDGNKVVQANDIDDAFMVGDNKIRDMIKGDSENRLRAMIRKDGDSFIVSKFDKKAHDWKTTQIQTNEKSKMSLSGPSVAYALKQLEK